MTRPVRRRAAVALVVASLASPDGVKSMVEYLAPVFWLFFLLVGVSLFVLRHREPNAERPFRVPFYPVTPFIFCLSSAYLLYASLSYHGVHALAGVVVLALGLPFLIWIRKAS